MLNLLTKKNKIESEWLKVSELKAGMRIAVPKDWVLGMHLDGMLADASSARRDAQLRDEDGEIFWDEIESIKHVGVEQVWDIEVEGTHNFIGNNIFAHNTVIFGAGEASTPTATTIRGAAATGLNIAGANLTFDASLGTGTGGSGALVFRTAPVAASSSIANTFAEIMRITPGGSVGIGIAAPTNILHVTGTPASGTPTARIANTLAGTTKNNGLLILAGNDTGVAASELITFQRPDATVIGSISQNGATTVAYNLSSDRRIKDNITPTVFGLADLLKIDVQDFSFINDISKQKMTGFIAQDLNNIFPGAVTTNGDNGIDSLALGITPWMIDYSKLTPLLVKSIQDLNLKITNIETLQANANNTNTFGQYAVEFFSSGIKSIVDGVVYMSNLVVDNLTIGSAEKPVGFTIYDKTNNAPFCVSMIAGVLASEPGNCQAVAVTSSPTPPASPTPTLDTTPLVVSDVEPPVITLNGGATIEIVVGGVYEELGATALDDVNGSVPVVISGGVDTSLVGTYTIHYNTTDSSNNVAIEVLRTVNVVATP